MKINRRFYVRSAAIFLLVILSVLMFNIGKQHNILLDNKTIAIEDKEYKALSFVEVQIDKTESIELARRDRDQALVTGQSHKIKVIYTDSSFNEIVLERKFKVPLSEEMLILSIPSFVANPDKVELYLKPFEIKAK